MISQNSPPVAARRRDLRLDFFRGLALLIIFVAHFRGDWADLYIPGRFGLSDSADIFVFCSGYATAIAFGETFLRRGFGLGLAKLARRCGQLYAAHIGLFFAAIAVGVALSGTGPGSYLRVIGLNTFFVDAPAALLGLARLSYVPNFFDILPLYLVLLAMVPIVVLLGRISAWLPIGAALGLYVLAHVYGLDFPADPLTSRGWYFDPLCWQLLFFAGFAFRSGWLRAPADSRVVTGAALAFVLLVFAASRPILFQNVPPFGAIEGFFVATADKTMLDPWRFLHFLALAQLAVVGLRGRERVLEQRVCRPIVVCGQQSLIVFVSGMLLSHVCGMLLVRTGDGVAPQIVLNLGGLGALIAIGYAAAWFKSAPWLEAPRALAALVPRASPPREFAPKAAAAAVMAMMPGRRAPVPLLRAPRRG